MGMKRKLLVGAAVLAAFPLMGAAQDRLAPVIDRSDIYAQPTTTPQAQPTRGPQPHVVQSQTASAPHGSIEERLQRLERAINNQALLDMLTTLENLQGETQTLRGDLEQMMHSMEGLKTRQRDLYMDIDSRLRQMEASIAQGVKSAAPAMNAQSSAGVGSVSDRSPAVAARPAVAGATVASAVASTSAQPGDPAQEMREYQKAFEVLKGGQYDQAISLFGDFLSRYPDGEYTGNAQYWLGEANYVTRRFDVAETEFQKVLSLHPDSNKVADAMLKLGYTFYELGNWNSARSTLQDVATRFPGTTVARLAENRLQKMRLEGR